MMDDPLISPRWGRQPRPELGGHLVVRRGTPAESAGALLPWQGEAFGRSVGIRLPDGLVLSPDASLMCLDRWQALTAPAARLRAALPRSCGRARRPQRRRSRGLFALYSKMTAYQANGALLGWLQIPPQQAVEVWLAGGEPQRFSGLSVL